MNKYMVFKMAVVFAIVFAMSAVAISGDKTSRKKLTERCELHMKVAGGCASCVAGAEVIRDYYGIRVKMANMVYIFVKDEDDHPDQYYIGIIDDEMNRDVCPEIYGNNNNDRIKFYKKIDQTK